MRDETTKTSAHQSNASILRGMVSAAVDRSEDSRARERQNRWAARPTAEVKDCEVVGYIFQGSYWDGHKLHTQEFSVTIPKGQPPTFNFDDCRDHLAEHLEKLWSDAKQFPGSRANCGPNGGRNVA